MKLPFGIFAGAVVVSPSRAVHWLQVVGPGLAAAAAVAAVARMSAQWLPFGLSEILVAVWLGLVLASIGWLPATTGAGLRFAQQRILRLGIILLGARLSLS